MIFELDEGTAARRRLPFRVFNSDGTSPDTGFSTTTVLHSINGGAQVVSTNSSSVVSANAGQYYIEFTQAELGTEGSITAFIDSQAADFPQMVGIGYVLNSNPYSSQSNIPLVATVTDVTNQVTADATAISGDATAANNLEAAFDGTGYDSGLTVFVKDSIATIAGVTNIATDVAAVQSDTDDIQTRLPAALVGSRMDADIGAISTDATAANNLESAFDGTGYDSGLTVFVKDSIATIAGVTNIATDVAAVQSDTDDIQTRLPAALVGGRIDANAGAISADAVAADNLEAAFDGTGYTSTLTVLDVTNAIATDDVQAGAIVTTSFGAAAIDAAALATDAGEEIADALLDRDMATGTDSGTSAVRTPRDAWRSLRNRVESDTTQVYVYQEDDTTIQWSASLVTAPSTDPHVTGADPNS